jgi:hypothetical protein
LVVQNADTAICACAGGVQVEEQKRRAEADKLAALTALETASAEFMREKEEKKELEAKIAAMQVRCRQYVCNSTPLHAIEAVQCASIQWLERIHISLQILACFTSFVQIDEYWCGIQRSAVLGDVCLPCTCCIRCAANSCTACCLLLLFFECRASC